MSENLRKKLTFMAKYSYVFILTLIFLIMSIATDRFLTVDNLLNVARQSSMLLIMALGMTMAMLLGRGVDMSMGAIVSISSCFAAGFFLQSHNWVSILLGVLVGIAIGALAGVVNGMLISFLHLPAMLVTYGVREILRGVAYAYMNGGVITSIHPAIRFIGSGRILGVIPTQIVIALLFTVLAAFLLKCTRMGRELYITGANPAAALFSKWKRTSSSDLYAPASWQLLQVSFMWGVWVRPRRKLVPTSTFKPSVQRPSVVSRSMVALETLGAS